MGAQVIEVLARGVAALDAAGAVPKLLEGVPIERRAKAKALWKTVQTLHAERVPDLKKRR